MVSARWRTGVDESIERRPTCGRGIVAAEVGYAQV